MLPPAILYFDACCNECLFDRGVAEADLQSNLSDGLARLVEPLGLEHLRGGEARRPSLDTRAVESVVDCPLTGADLACDVSHAHPTPVKLDDLVVLAHSEPRNSALWRRVGTLDPFPSCTTTEVAHPCYLWGRIQVASQQAHHVVIDEQSFGAVFVSPNQVWRYSNPFDLNRFLCYNYR